jgi:glycosyltransferase involved in cell wall biosynthesis
MEQAELAEFYKDKDIFLSLNNYDTFSIATAEAMASGLIPVVTTETGISRYIINGENGFTLDFHFSHDLLNIIAEIINMPAGTLNNISNASYETMINLKWNNVYEMYKPIYNGMMK